jgi:hypothetical protein
LLDLAGLISPETIDFLADDEGMSRYVLTSDADYLVTAPGWPYKEVAETVGTQLLYSTNYDWSQAQGINNMMVYELP